MSHIKGGDLADQHVQGREAEALYFMEFFDVDISTKSQSYEQHGADVSVEELDSRIQSGETWAATRFVNDQAHMMCRERFIASYVEEMNRPEVIASGRFVATLAFGEPIGEGVVTASPGDLETARWVDGIDKATFYFEYNNVLGLWIEITGYPAADPVSDERDLTFAALLTEAVGAPPVGMIDPHAHHILFKKGLGEAQQALVQEGQIILEKHGIDPVYGVENLVWAPMRVTGQHGIEALRNVVDSLKQVDAAGGDYDDIVQALQKLGDVAAKRR